MAPNVTMVEPGDRGRLPTEVADLEERPFGAGPDVEAIVPPGQGEDQGFVAEDLARNAIGADPVDRVLAG